MKRKHRRTARGHGRADDRRGPGRPPPSLTEARGGGSKPPGGHPQNRDGTGVWLSGVHAALASAATPERRVHRIVLSPEAGPTLGPRLAALGEGRSARLPAPEILARDQLDRLLPRGAVHQGIGLRADEL